ncbi:beta-glucuronidase-like isoform X3 [Scylla paramamosain]|uniref:beta-glucuronidase-like isoform X3 n=2 Tax=Scylla paramamosain TaxID=85552 RepID=UPI0030832B38
MVSASPRLPTASAKPSSDVWKCSCVWHGVADPKAWLRSYPVPPVPSRSRSRSSKQTGGRRTRGRWSLTSCCSIISPLKLQRPAMTPPWLHLTVLALGCLRAGALSKNVGDASWGGLYPRESPTREVRSLDGLWDFRLAPLLDPDKGFREHWYSQPLSQTGAVISMAVPSSYNDITQDKALRDHIGWAWYDRTFYVPMRWQEDKLRVVLRLGSAHYNSIVYVNGVQVAKHEGGHLPIMAEISNHLSFVQENLVTVAINNTLTPTTIPQGSIHFQNDPTRYPPGYFTQSYNFDFTNYAGIHRPVFLYTTPRTYIEDILLTTAIDGTSGIVNYTIIAGSTRMGPHRLGNIGCSLKVLNQARKYVTSAIGCQGTIVLPNATLWWPYLMSDDPGYQYTLMVAVSGASGDLDLYPQKVGIRSVGWNSTTLTINGVPVYLRGCGKHEDADIRGKGLDYPLMVKDFSLLKWLGANSFRTSHYPYAEEIMDMADQEGIMVVDEAPAVGLSGFGEELMKKHMSVMQELVRRDKNRPSVIMWSVGNEPQSNQAAAEGYFSNVTAVTRASDATRPVTCVLSYDKKSEHAASSLDVILVNRYYSWYSDTGHLEVIQLQTVTEFTEWFLLHNKPVMISEYGAGSLSGLHMDPAFTWSEEYQVELMMQNFEAFDKLRSKGFFVGEMIWNFADFATPQGSRRVAGNKKGVFTRSRQPKMAAHVLRWRYHSLAGSAQQLGNATALWRHIFSPY